MIHIQFSRRSYFLMPRRFFRRSRSSNRDKYSVENTSIAPPVSDGWTQVTGSGSIANSKQFAIAVLPPTEVQGMRKVKHFTLTFSCPDADPFLFYALVYVPDGYEANTINIPIQGNAASLYEPNQYVISSGVLDFSGGPLRIRSPLSRNLNSGDSIYLVLASTTQPPAVRVNVQYAITLQ